VVAAARLQPYHHDELPAVEIPLDHVLKGIGHVSTIFAPAAIVVTFVQTLALLLDLDTAWPPGLKAWMQAFSILNVNMEMAKPDCSGP
jgi:hypothetical protein